MSEDEADPFDSLDEPEDREGDPFERLGDVEPSEDDDEASGDEEPPIDGADGGGAPTLESGGESAAEGTTDTDEPAFEEEFIDEGDPFPAGPGTTPGQSSADGSTVDQRTGDDDPLGADDPFSGMEGREGDPFGEGGSVFESVDVESVDADEVWASLDEEPETATVEGTRYTDVSKHRFCEQCEHFSSPPDAHCTNEEAEIIEYLDMETVRLLNCPVVAEQRELEKEE